ncbi:hypothetical protein PLESTB_001506300 [Pleodorina starrii]|uniref:Uncharacterized protein n=1 Tax=Pleodorina starrii TaxID=330485 RepID=A0A9W6BXE7_9CHLO|nr:hypothetical protein PLESTM_000659500 [Pleodorina starrii]GLC59615.1 hypothetical protein PLESTB_001506300 [Pleodorina starrii]
MAYSVRQGAVARAATRRPAFGARPVRPIVPLAARGTVRAKASDSDVGTAGVAAIALGLPANAIMLWSEWTLKTTGSGLPPGPGGALGAAEGVSYLLVLGIIGWSIYTKATTGTGLPAGPAGLLGAVEGVSYLSLLAGIIVFALKYLS